MIGFIDTLTLARAKLRSKKVLLSVTVVLASLVFGIIITGMIVVTGASRSANTYLQAALGGKYLVAVNPIIPDEILGYGSMTETPSDTLKAHLTDLQKQYIAEQEKLAKQYDVAFNSESIDPILKANPFGAKDAFGNVTQVINRDAPAYQMYVLELQNEWLKTASNSFTDLKKLAGVDGATTYYQNQRSSLGYANAMYLTNGKEDLTKIGQPLSTDYTSFIQNSAYTFTDQSLINRYVLPENAARQANKKAIPVVVTAQEATKLFSEQIGIPKEPSDAAGKIIWMKALQEKLNGLTYQACYRSPGEIALIQQTMQQNQTDTSMNSSLASMQSSIMYNLPTSTCAPVTIKKDSRTTAEKQADANLEAYQKAAGTYQPQITQLLTFQIVGIMPLGSQTDGKYNDIPSLITGLLGSQYQDGAFIPTQLYTQLSVTEQHKDILQYSTSVRGENVQKLVDAGITPAIISFPSAASAKKFINTNTCLTMDESSCKKPWTSQLYGPNYLLTDDISKKVGDIAKLVLPIALIVAAIIMSFTMARVIIDSRHETAVFRALGAKRIDIMRIYLIYSVMVAVLVAIFSFLIGTGGAVTIELLYGPEITDQAKVAYGVFDSLGKFSLIGVDGMLLGIVAAAILLVGILAVLPPLIRNVRRNPIRDMRDE